MKKTLFAVLALAFVTSCSNEEVVEMAQKEAIAFDNAFVDNSTRSVSDPSITNSNIANFDVYGFVDKTGKIFEGTDVTGSGVTGVAANDEQASWSYSGTPQYWIAGAIYNFCAVAPANAVNATSTVVNAAENTNDTNNSISTTFSYTNTDTDQKDLLYSEAACVAGKTTGNDYVRFTFRHLLSKVKFSFKNGYNGTNATIKVTGIKITDAYSSASATLTSTTTSWTGQTGELILNFGDATANPTEEISDPSATDYGYNTTYESYNEKLLIPSSSKEYTVEFVVTLFVSGTQIAEYQHTGENAAKVTFTPEAGKSYNITATINASNINPDAEQEQIQFTVTTVNGWETGTASDVTIEEPAASN